MDMVADLSPCLSTNSSDKTPYLKEQKSHLRNTENLNIEDEQRHLFKVNTFTIPPSIANEPWDYSLLYCMCV